MWSLSHIRFFGPHGQKHTRLLCAWSSQQNIGWLQSPSFQGSTVEVFQSPAKLAGVFFTNWATQDMQI